MDDGKMEYEIQQGLQRLIGEKTKWKMEDGRAERDDAVDYENEGTRHVDGIANGKR
jgi:hypothetical protein